MIWSTETGDRQRSAAGQISVEWRGPDTSRRLTPLLAILAAAVVELAICEDTIRPVPSILAMGGMLGATFGLQRLIDWLRPTGEQFQALAVGLCCLAAGALWCEVALREAQGSGLPLELLLMAAVRNIVLVLAGLAGHTRLQGLCCGLSLFGMVFAASVTTGQLAHGTVVGYIVVGSWWLMGRHWDGMRGHIESQTLRQTSRRWYVVLPSILALISGAIWMNGGRPLNSLGGFVGSSGGVDRFDPHSRGGVNDGDALVPATENAASFGPVESEIFLDSESPSLYDVFNEQYGDPPKPQKTELAVALPNSLFRETDNRVAESGDAGRDFSTMRLPRSAPKSLQDRETPALLYVSGRTPLHLRLDVFDFYNGRVWRQDAAVRAGPGLSIEMVGGKPWGRVLPVATAELSAGRDVHQLKINSLRTNRIPTPWQPLGVHIDRIDRTEFFQWPHESVLGMNREQLPEGVVIHLQSRPLERRMWNQIDSIPAFAAERYRLIGADAGSQRIRALAREWTRGIPSGHRQIDAIVSQLRNGYVHDRGARVPAHVENSVDHFLTSSRRGPDYLFASSAAMLLRSLGYSTRVVSGFYANPESYDPLKRITPIRSEDAHFWTEVYVGSNIWVEIEPTPGYEQLYAPPGLVERLWSAAAGVASWLLRRWHWLAAGAAVGLLGWRRRFVIRDRLATIAWNLFVQADPRERVLQTLRLLEHRRLWFGPPASLGATLRGRLVADLQLLPAEQRPTLRRFLACADWASFGLEAPLPVSPEEAASLCRRAAQIVTREIWSVPLNRHRGRPDCSVPAAASLNRPWSAVLK